MEKMENLYKSTNLVSPNKKLDGLIEELKILLTPSQHLVNNKFDKPEGPVIAVVGCSRSGTTFVTQILAKTGAFSYPSNLMNRFAYAPYIGALIQKLLLDADYDFNNELYTISSELGKTKGHLNINEFFHFWRRFFPNHDPRFLDKQEQDAVQVVQLRKEIASIESAFGKPFMAKAKMLQYNIPFFSEKMPELVFLHIRRQPLFVMQSLIEARIKYFGTFNSWYGNKPPQYSFLKDTSPEMQVAGQVFFTENSIQQSGKNLNPSKYIEVNYEDVCKNPAKFLDELGDRLQFSINKSIESNYPVKNERRLDNSVLQILERNYQNFKSQNV